jgi:uncharacterized membrane protein YdjX (TVP38/TMEM64 family)
MVKYNKKEGKKENKDSDFFSELLKHLWIFLIIAGILSYLIYNYLHNGIIHSLLNSNVNEVSNYIRGFGILAPLIYIALLVVEIVVAPISGVVFAVIGGALFGTFLGGTLLIAGNFIGSLICFWIARRFARKPIEIIITKEKMERFDEYSKKYGAFALFFLKVNPFTGSDIWNYAAGITKISLKSFAIAIFFASIPMAYVQAFFGHKLVTLNPIFYTWMMLASLLYLMLFIVAIYYIVWKYKTKTKKIKKQEINKIKQIKKQNI